MSQLPQGWYSSQLKDLLSFVLGGDWGKDPEYNDDDFETVFCIRGTEFKNWSKEKGASSVERKVKSSSAAKRALKSGDILIEISGGGPEQPVGRTVLIDDAALSHNPDYPKVCTNFIRLARPMDSVDSRYLNYYLQNFYASGEVVNYQGGSNNLRNLKFKEYETIQVPVAPFEDQKRIADKLDSVLAKVEAAHARLDKIPTILKRFRQSILAAATSGELTKDWREQQSGLINVKKVEGKYLPPEDFSGCEIPSNWVKSPIGNFCSFQQGMQIAKATRHQSPAPNRLPILRIGNYTNGFTKDVDYVEIDENSLIAEADELILTRTGESRGRVLTGFRGVFHNNTFRINFDSNIIQKQYLYFALNEVKTQNYVLEVSGRSAQPDLTHKKFGPCPISIPPMNEQTKIVERLESLFEHANTVEKQYNAAKARLDKLTQSILAKAFRGELVKRDVDSEVTKLERELAKLQ